ncbi:helix-turn-helix domain-containing protein [Dokdonia sp. Hel_I_53]|uniref:helix-turn-helix domain-containing protein n=1 Tax=Dokdonia sp. Hel_I_53 TaxID=1566287 RepID=UPI00119C3C79|nr:helix-turn-helix transcriptional regulator [Dokdonia sp. Hel_I_53]TVZ51580.1 transcriptional regulator with XRE-family HTH domain [Dokdonia sp. Hel_I_53]
METLLNHKKFARRLQKVMNDHQLSAAAFAEKLEVGRATISHLMSGRNKPSLDFVMKVTSTFETVDLDWLIYGEINPKKKPHSTPQTDEKLYENHLKNEVSKNEENFKNISTNSSKVKRVILLMSDGTFESYDV